ncbi:MAG: hypothetical protein K9J79_03880 [Desulfobacteraceae bacterium]|nr:hypothetical protein [Desulfobacteraceae bacterium]
MRKYITISMIALSFVLASSSANAFDYKNWIPLLPENISGMEKQGDPSGMNMEKSGQSWSALRQEYSDADGNDIRFSIVTGSNGPGIKEFETMQQFNMETPEKNVKTLDIAGHKAVLELNKKGGKSNLLISAQEETLVVIDTTSFDNEDDIISLADDVPLSEIADSVD